MVTDYVVFMHGVSTRENAYDPDYADHLFANIQEQITSRASSLQLKKVPLYWGDVTKDEEAQLKQTYERSPTWPQFWFRNARETLLLQFIGDAALYISRYVGAKIVEKLKDQLLGSLDTHDVTQRVQQFRRILAQARGGRPRPWSGFAHPGDPLADPLVPLLYEVLAIEQPYLTIHDQISHPIGLLDRVLGLISQSPIA